MIKLLVTDLDGTLLTGDKTVSPANLAALDAARKKGVYTTVATGRMIDSARHFAKLMGANAPLICCNGGLIQDADADTPIYARTYDADFAREFLAYAVGRGWYTQWHVKDGIYSTDYRPEYFGSYRTVPNFRVHEVGDRYLDDTANILQFVVRDMTQKEMPSMLADIRARFGAHCAASCASAKTADIMPHGVNKGDAVERLAAHLGIAPDEIMVCGDADNDLDMLRRAAHAVVPANGSDEAKAHATFLAPSCDENAIAAAIHALIP